MRVALLADHIGAIDMLAAWYEQEWGPYYGDHGPGDAAADLASRCNRDRLPAGLVAMDDDKIVGTAALGRDAASGLVPAVVGLLVVPEYRRKAFLLHRHQVDLADAQCERGSSSDKNR